MDEGALAEARALRNTALGLVRTDVERVRASLAAKPVGEQLRDAALGKLVDGAETARTVAEDNKLVVGLGLAALVGWVFRRRITAWAAPILRTLPGPWLAGKGD